jgi:hypothetical protein
VHQAERPEGFEGVGMASPSPFVNKEAIDCSARLRGPYNTFRTLDSLDIVKFPNVFDRRFRGFRVFTPPARRSQVKWIPRLLPSAVNTERPTT